MLKRCSSPPKLCAAVNYEDDDVQFVLFNLSRFMELNMGDVYTSYARGQKKNVGPNMLVGLSNYRGGELWLFDERGDVYVKLPDTLPGAWRQRLFESANLKSGPAGEILVPGIAVDVRRRFVGFDGRWPHAVLPFEGERFSLVFFSRQLCQQFMQKLRRWNFNFPALLEIEATPQKKKVPLRTYGYWTMKVLCMWVGPSMMP